MSATTADGPILEQLDPSDGEGVDEPLPSSTWLAAYVMGLVASRRDATAVDELRGYTQGEGHRALRGALDLLDDPARGDELLRARGRSLIEAALGVSAAESPTIDLSDTIDLSEA